MNTFLNIAGLTTNILGTIMLAVSLNGYIKSMRLAIDAHELFVISFLHPNRPVVQITGTDTHMNRDRKRSGWLTWFGLILVIAGFGLQLASYLFN